MYRRYYPRYNDFEQEPQRPMAMQTQEEEKVEEQQEQEPEIIVPEKPQHKESSSDYASYTSSAQTAKTEQRPRGFLGPFRRDDLLLLALILLFLQDNVQDYGILIVLVFLFFIGF